jgi:ribonuclease HI
MINMKELIFVGNIKTPYIEYAPQQVIDDDGDFYIQIYNEYKSALLGLDSFNYIYVLYYMDRLKIDLEKVIKPSWSDYKRVGLFASRTQNRPNPIGLSVVKINKLKGNKIYISAIDALDNTPVLDIKPYIKEIDLKADANNGWINIDKLTILSITEKNGLKSIDTVILYTDGACSGNPGPGGYAALLIQGENKSEITGYEAETTNNRMELKAVIEGLKKIKNCNNVKLYSDSNYVLQGLSKWLRVWKEKGWKTSNKKNVKNIDLWQELDDLIQGFNIEYIKVKGHSDNEYNNRVDYLAKKQIELNNKNCT